MQPSIQTHQILFTLQIQVFHTTGHRDDRMEASFHSLTSPSEMTHLYCKATGKRIYYVAHLDHTVTKSSMREASGY